MILGLILLNSCKHSILYMLNTQLKCKTLLQSSFHFRSCCYRVDSPFTFSETVGFPSRLTCLKWYHHSSYSLYLSFLSVPILYDPKCVLKFTYVSYRVKKFTSNSKGCEIFLYIEGKQSIISEIHKPGFHSGFITYQLYDMRKSQFPLLITYTIYFK